ncbi:hypothetical protein [Vibrio harveyi]|uniref:hypothetical protein n=1 Tax=Vibrio harveyi TaxID=669 RepID=UPI00217E9CA3|nr:hypothetical protein [Vibrio harveyi]
MQSKTQICNGALLRVGHTERVANIDSERSLAAEQCREFWQVSLESALEGLNPSFARRIEKLSILSDEKAWGYKNAYLMPDDCLAAREVVCDDYHKTRKVDTVTKIDFIKGQTEDGKKKTIFTDLDNAYLVYTTRNIETHMFDNTTCIAVSLMLGSNLALSLKKDVKLAQALQSQAMAMFSKSESIDINSQNSDVNSYFDFKKNPAVDERLS